MEYISYIVVMKHLKVMMKAQKISYGRLSTLIKIPESTLKKWFAASDGPFSRLNLICAVLGTTLEDVLKEIGKENVRTFKMDKAQQEYFLKDRDCFKVYWLLAYERYSAENIASVMKISMPELKKHFLRLDRLKLVDYSVKEKVLAPKTIPVRWSPEGPFMQEIFKEWSLGIIKESLHSKKATDLILQYFQLGPESESEFKKDLLALEEKYARRTIRELSSKKASIKTLRFVAATAEGSFL